MDDITRQWIRGPADEKAAANGCRFDITRAQFAVDWIQRYCVLYEGDCAGQPLILQDWQLEFAMRLFGWVRFNSDWNCETRRFKRASVFIAKKNKKTPTIAAIGLYLLSGDGEQGQKVFSTAKDGKQAMLAHTHAMEMTRRSIDLMTECVINRTTGRITHEPTRSFYDVISGDNIEGQEGLNGSVIVDETHVVDERLMKRLKYAGISRREPLHIEVSTAGTNPDSYGKRQFDHALAVQQGRYDDQELLAMVFAAPQELTDAELDADPVKFGKMANPAWGHTIREEEFVASYHAAKKSISDMLDFKMYRLNIWQRSSNPWLKMSDWDKCGPTPARTLTEADVEGQSCVGSLDLSRVSDFTSFTRQFVVDDNDEAVRQITTLWMTRAYATANNHMVPFLDWAKAGYIRIIEGDVMDYGVIESDIIAMNGKTPIEKLIFDELFAEEITQRISDEIGCERVVFKQNIMTYAKPTDDFEALAIAGKLYHDGNPAVAWQIGHCEVYRDANGNKRPIKPDGRKGGLKKIDAVVTSIMCLPFRNQTASPYDSGGIFSV